MPRSVRVFEVPVPCGTWIVVGIGEPRVVLSSSWVTRVASIDEAIALSLSVSNARVAFGCPRGTGIIRNGTVAAHTVIVVDRAVVLRHWSVVVDDRAITVVDGLTACSVVRNARITVDRRLTLVSDPRIVGNRLLFGNRSSVIDARIVSRTTLVGNARIMITMTLISDATIISNARVVTRVTLIRNWTLVGNPRIVLTMTLIGNARVVVPVTVVSNPRIVIPVVLVAYMAVSGNRSGSWLPVAMRVDVGIELVSVLELALLLEALLLGETIAFSGVCFQLLRFGSLALGFGCLYLGVGVSLLRFGLATLGVRFPGMDFMLRLGSFLTDPGGLLALVFALLSRGLTTDRNDDADDNQNNDDRYDYPDDGSCIHALSPCCLFGSH